MSRYEAIFFACLLSYVTCDDCLTFDDSDILFLFDYSASTGNVWPSLMAFSRAIMEQFEKRNQIRYCFVHYRSILDEGGEPECPRGDLIVTTEFSCVHIGFKQSEKLNTDQIIEILKDGEFESESGTPTVDGFKAAELLLNARAEQDRRSVLIFVGDGDTHDKNRTYEGVNRIKLANTTIFTARCSGKSNNGGEENLRNWATSQNETFNCDEITENSPNHSFKYQRLGELVADSISKNICKPPIASEQAPVKKSHLLAGIVSGVLAALILLLVAFFWSRRRKVKFAKNEQVQVEPKVVDLSQGLGVSMSLEEEVFLPRVTPVKNDKKKFMKMTKVKKKTA